MLWGREEVGERERGWEGRKRVGSKGYEGMRGR